MTTKTTTPAKARLATLAAVGIIYPVAALGATTMFSGTAYAADAPATIMQIVQDQAQFQPVSFQNKDLCAERLNHGRATR